MGLFTPSVDVAIVIEGGLLLDLESNIVNELSALNYDVQMIHEQLKTPIIADRVIITFTGELAANDSRLLYTGSELIDLELLLKLIDSPVILIMTITCNGGERWLQFAQDGRILISNANNTYSYYEEITPTPSLDLLLSMMHDQSVESAFAQWEQRVLHYNQWVGGEFLEVDPIMFDGIAGDTYF